MRAAGKKERLLFIVLFIAFLGVIVLLAGPWLSRNFLEPLALGLWLLLRIFVLSIDQGILWSLMILVIVGCFFLRPRRDRKRLYEEQAPMQNAALRDLERWRYLFAEKPRSAKEFGSLRRELAWTLCSVYASRKRIHSDYEVRDAFVGGRISLDEDIYAFLFAEAPAKGLKRPEYDRKVEACLSYFESQLEIGDDDE